MRSFRWFSNPDPIDFLLRALYSSIVTSPRDFILWSAFVSFIFSYPFLISLLSFYSTETSPFSSSIYQQSFINQNASTEYAISVANSPYNGETLFAKQLSIIEPALKVDEQNNHEDGTQLSDIIILQQLFTATNLDESRIYDALEANLELPYIVIPHLSTLKKKLQRKQPLKSLSLSYFCDSKLTCDLWDNALKTITESYGLNVFSDNLFESNLLLNLVPSITHFSALSPYSVQVFALFALTGAYLLVLAYIALSIFKLRLVRSKFGIFMTFLLQTIASICSTYTILNLVAPPFAFHQFRHFFTISFIVLVITAEDTFRLINNVSRTPDECPPTQKLLTAFLSTVPEATKRVLINSLLLFILSLPLNIPGIGKILYQLRILCLFGALSLVVSFILHITFFTSILLIDIQRTELEDLIWTPDAYGNNGAFDGSPIYNATSLSNSKPNKLRLHQRLFMVLDPIFKINIPFTQTRITSTMIIFFYIAILSAIIPYSGYEEALLAFHLNSIFSSVPASFSTFSYYFSRIVILLSSSSTPFHNINKTPLFLASSTFMKSVSLTPLDLLASSSFKNLLVSKPIIIELQQTSMKYRIIDNTVVNNLLNIINSFTVHSVLEFIASIIFIVSLTHIVLRLILPLELDETEPANIRDSDHFFFSKDLLGFHELDVLSIYSQGSYIVTLSMDHKLCLWNLNFSRGRSRVLSQGHQPMNIPVTNMMWPISNVVLSVPNFCLAVFSTKSATVLCWNFKINSVVFQITDPQILSTKPICSFFSGNSLVFVSKNNTLVTISNTPNNREPKIMKLPFREANSYIIAAERILTPPMPERLVFVSSANEIIIATHVGKKWIMKGVKLYESMNSPTQTLPYNNNNDILQQPTMTLPPSSINTFNASRSFTRDTMQFPPMAKYSGIRLQSGHDMKGILQIPKIPGRINGKFTTLISIPRLNMIFLAYPLHGILVDIQTGMISKHLQLGNFSPKSLRIFHSEPTHCRFCGVTSIESFSVAYSDLEDPKTVICHTYTIDNRSKNNICLRIERDPREIRCLGFEATTERQHWINRVEGWETTGINMIMGVRRKEYAMPPAASQKLDPYGSGLNTNCTIIGNYEDEDSDSDDSHYFDNDFQDNNGGMQYLRRRNVNENDSKDDQRHGFNPLPVWSVLRSTPKTLWLAYQIQKKPPLAVTWEGWVMSASGKVSYYDIPESYSDGLNGKNDAKKNHNDQQTRLLIGTIGPVARYGNKSIAVAFGNIIKVLYFGNEESLSVDDSILDSVLDRTGRRNRSRNSSISSIKSSSSRMSISSRGSFADQGNSAAQSWRRAPSNF